MAEKQSLLQLLFSPHGRLNRLQYFLIWLGIFVSFWVIIALMWGTAVIFGGEGGDMNNFVWGTLGILLLVYMVLVTYIGIVTAIKRLRDIGWSPWLVLLFLVPIVNLILGLLLLVMPSKE